MKSLRTPVRPERNDVTAIAARAGPNAPIITSVTAIGIGGEWDAEPDGLNLLGSHG